MIFAVAIMGVVYFSQVGLDNLISRWDDLATENAGSSRLRMWQGAWLHFKNSDLTTILFGGCQDNVRNAMIAYLGADIHTHSDLFDQMLSNGLVGISVLALFFFALFKISLSINHRSFHFAIAFALFGMLLICSILTSQILYTHSMLAYVVLITCQYKLGQQDRMLRK
jgi:O-antigen ligase